jgi:hypothetical protein
MKLLIREGIHSMARRPHHRLSSRKALRARQHAVIAQVTGLTPERVDDGR